MDSYFESGILKVIVNNSIIFSARMLDIIYELSFYMKLNSIYQDVLVLCKEILSSFDRYFGRRPSQDGGRSGKNYIIYFIFY